MAGSKAIRVDMLERLYFLLRHHPKDQWIIINPSMLSITGLGLDNFIELIKSLRFEIKYEETGRDDEIITVEKNDVHFKVLFRKIIISKKEKKSGSSKTEKNVKYNRKNIKSEKNNLAKIDSPFAALRNLFEN